ncbi:MAG TPA: hypothetical protein VGF45_02045 [Polyangia bacterium]
MTEALPKASFAPPSPHRPAGTAGATAFAALLVAGLAALAGFAKQRASALRAGWPPEADVMYLPPSTTLRRLSLGHTELAADLVAARANVYYGTMLATRAPQRWLDQYIHTAVDLDPKFHRLYMSGAAMLVYYGGAITTTAVERANALLARGEKAFPNDWNLPFQLGFNSFWELPATVAPDDPRIPGWRQTGVEALRRAALFEGVPAWLPNLAARLLTKQGADELAVRYLEQAYAATSSEETREQIRGKLELLKSRQLVDQMEAGRKELEAELARGYDYAGEAFSIIAGPRDNGGFTLPQLRAPTLPTPTSSPTPPTTPTPKP